MVMYEIIKRNWLKTKIIASFGIAITLLILIAVIYKSDNKGAGKPEVFITLDQKSDVIGLRISITATGCNGYSYVLDYATELEPTDEVWEISNISILVDQESLQYIKGTEIDFEEEGFNQVFKFKNPNATGECGCGERFSI